MQLMENNCLVTSDSGVGVGPISALDICSSILH